MQFVRWIVHASLGVAMGMVASGRPLAWADDRPTLTVAVNALPTKLDPADNFFAPDLRIAASVFDTLIKRDYLAEIKQPGLGAALTPSLAESWMRLDDRTLELRLRRGVRFHNGDELTARDVAVTFSQERIFGENAWFPGARRYLGDLEPVQILDPYTVRIRARASDSLLEYRLASWGARIVNGRAYTELGRQGFARAPVGTGPIKLLEWRTSELMRFAPHDDYFGGRPSFGALFVREVPLASSRVNGLITGEYDIVNQLGSDQLADLSGRAGIAARPSALEQPIVLWVWGSQPAVSDKRVRQALALAIDRELIVEQLQGGMVPSLTTFQLPVFGAFYDPGRPGLRHDPDRAARLLREAGYAGQPIVFRVVGNYYVGGESVAQAVEGMWRAVGLNARIEIVENFSQALGDGRDVVLGGCTYAFPTPEGLGPCFFAARSWAEQYGFPAGVGTMPTLGRELIETGDATERRRLFIAMLDQLETEVPAIPLYLNPQHYAARSGVGWLPYPDLAMDFRPENLSFSTARR